MRTLVFQLAFLIPLCLMSQWKSDEIINLSENLQDDSYIAGRIININAMVEGDVIAAGSDISVNDTITQDLIVAGGEVRVKGYVADDIRGAGGTLTIGNNVGDDVVLAGGETYIEHGSVIEGNLISFSGVVHMNGEVMGKVKATGGELNINGKVNDGMELHGGDLILDGEIHGASKIVANDIEIGANAKFYDDITYWCNAGKVNFTNAMVNGEAVFDQSLAPSQDDFSWKGFGIAAFGFWIFYALSAFLILLLLNWGLKKLFSETAENLKTTWPKGLGNGIIYIFGTPVLIVFAFVILIGIPVGLLVLSLYLFSLFFGHLVTALLMAHYLNHTRTMQLNFWTITLLAWGVAIVLRLLTFIPFLGILISLVVIAIGYGVLGHQLLKRRKDRLKIATS